MHAPTGSTPESRSRGVGLGARWTAVLAAAVLVAACGDRDRDELPDQPTPSPGLAERDADRDRPTPSPGSEPGQEHELGQQDQQGLAQRGGEPDATRPGMGMPPETDPTLPSFGAPGQSPTQMQQESQKVERSASGDLQSFERRLERELAAQDFAVAAAVDLQGEPKLRMMVVAPKAADERGQGQGQAGADRPGGTATTPGAEGSASKRAELALEQARVLVAYTEEDEADRVRVAYMLAPQERSDIDAAIDRAMNEQEGAGKTPQSDQGEQDEPPDKDKKKTPQDEPSATQDQPDQKTPQTQREDRY